MNSNAELLDPTRPPILGDAPKKAVSKVNKPVKKEKKIEWKVSSILISPERQAAVINGHSVTVGDKVEGAEVLSINKSEITLQKKRRVIVVDLDSPDVSIGYRE